MPKRRNSPLVLIADGDEERLATMVETLDPHARLLTAVDAVDAEHQILEHHPDCVIAQDQLPGGGGFELLDKARQANEDAPRILVNTSESTGDVIRSVTSGLVHSYVMTPFVPKDLVAAVLRVLNPRASCVLVVDDQRTWREVVKSLFERAGVEIGEAENLRQAVQRLREQSWDAVLVDLQLGEESGLDLLRLIRSQYPSLPVLICTITESPQLAADLRRAGAYSYVTKDSDHNILVFEVMSALEDRAWSRQSAAADQDGSGNEIVGRSGVMAEVRRMISAVAKSDAPVLIRGETGTGKELVARAIHAESERQDFFAVNCAALTETLFESEMFGHERGAFSGAVAQKPGLCELASNGTLFLDEVGELPLSSQAKLLRFLQAGEYMRVGGTKVLMSNARILAATNRPLEKMVEKETFRADLLYRLNIIAVGVPPLRERMDDVPLLVPHLLAKVGGRHRRGAMSLSPAVLETLLSYHWPGNIRELEGALERAVLMAPGQEIQEIKLDSEPIRRDTGERATTVRLDGTMRDIVKNTVAQVEQAYLKQLLTAVNGSVSEVARRAGLDRRNLYRKLKEHDIDPEQFREP